MPYDPADARALLSAERLTVHVVGAGDAPDVTYDLARPQGGVVEARRFPAHGTPDVAALDADALLAEFEGARRAGRRVSVESVALRRWLTGR